MAEIQDGQDGKKRKRPAGKIAVRSSASKVKATIHISDDASKRLSVHAAMLGVDRSELVENLIQLHLRRFVVSDRGGEEGPASGDAA